MRFKSFEIRKPNLLVEPTIKDYYKYNFDIVKWNDDKEYCWSIGSLHYRTDGNGFEFKSVGLRYLEDREEGLEHFILKWCELQELLIESEDTE